MTGRPRRIVGALSLGLLGQVAIMAVPAVIVELAGQWSLDAAQVGWLGDIYFAGYAAGLPFLSGAAGRTDGWAAYAISTVIAGVASLAFAFCTAGFWSALVLRFIAGVGFSGIHIIGLKLMSDRLEGHSRARAAAFYSAAYAIGSGGSFLIAGLLSSAFGWSAAFVAAGASALLSLPLLLLIGSPLKGNEIRSTRWFPDFRAALREREVTRYVIAYAGNTWEVFAIRVWFAPFLAFSAELNQSTSGWPPAVLAGISAIVAVPVSIEVRVNFAGDDLLGHDFSQRRCLGVQSVAKHREREITVSDDTRDTAPIADKHRADMVVCHCPHGLIRRRPRVQNHHSCSTESLERHVESPFRVSLHRPWFSSGLDECNYSAAVATGFSFRRLVRSVPTISPMARQLCAR